MHTIALVLVATVVAAAQPKARLHTPPQNKPYHYRLLPKAGTLYTYANTVEMAQTIHVMGMDQAITSTVTFEQDVQTRLDTLVELVIGQRNVRIEISGLAQLGQGDSVMTLPELEDYKLRLQCTRNGRVVQQDFLRNEQKNVLGESIRQQALEQLTGGGVRMRFIVEFPDTLIKPGAQWTRTVNDTLQMSLGSQTVMTTMDLRHTFEGYLDTLGRRCVVVRVESTRYLVSGTAEQMGIPISINGDGAISARYVIEAETGMPLVIETTAQLDQRMTLDDQSSSVIPLSIDVRGRMVRKL